MLGIFCVLLWNTLNSKNRCIRKEKGNYFYSSTDISVLTMFRITIGFRYNALKEVKKEFVNNYLITLLYLLDCKNYS